ncbi:hypothetical protein [Actinoplanes aureus]|uniref:IrrE N-terminal-like domain-containing protein n=1 Tax=Actinoplanes aureus TaxID=2792083 RepID=A0A931CJH5_9ACTN|nr:hypothetical protein [Actinoplanes aureus]MBG0567551.1 hypothetical protein [Actinoplanes aureus]
MRDLHIPQPLDMEALCHAIGVRTGRSIRLYPMAMPDGGPNGVWMATEHGDIIFYESGTSRVHQMQIILHELGHLLCSHDAVPGLEGAATAILAPDLDPGLVQRMLGRTHYSVQEEREAEMIASLILQKATDWTPEPQPVVPADAAPVVERIHRSLSAGSVSSRRNPEEGTRR